MCITIMIVEDYQPLLEAMVQALEPLAASVIGVDNPVCAMKLIENKQPDVLISDWDLQSHLNGGDMARFALQNRSGIKVVIITGKELPQVISTMEGVDVFRYIAKPFALKDIREVVRECY